MTPTPLSPDDQPRSRTPFLANGLRPGDVLATGIGLMLVAYAILAAVLNKPAWAVGLFAFGAGWMFGTVVGYGEDSTEQEKEGATVV